MKLQNAFTLQESPQRVFDLLLDVESIATCMPGSTLLGRDGDAYQGKVKLKVGPLSVAYRGDVRFVSVDAEQRRVTLRASGAEQAGQGSAEAEVVAAVTAQGAGTVVTLDTDLEIRGRVAQFGRGVIGDVAQMVLDQFAANVERLLRADEGVAPGGTTVAEPLAAPPAESSVDVVRLILLPQLRRAAPYLGGAAVVAALSLLLRRARHS
jgi:carbon monoxide dehydrogenase subunit G